MSEAETGLEALQLCKIDRPDIILSDWMMPGMDGLEFCRAFRQLPSDRYSYFILLTSKSDKDEVAQGLESGADDFLTKPVNGHELRARIQAGERILAMQAELFEKNRVIADTLSELQVIHDRLDKDLLEAQKLQMSLLPRRVVRFRGSTVASFLKSSGHVGGDLVGQYRIDDRRLGLFSIDVSGHGISSALMTARLAGYLSATSPEQNVAMQHTADGYYLHLPPNEVIARLNRIALEDMATEHYFTMLLAEVDFETGAVTMSQAGHPHPVVLRADGGVEQTGPGGLPVGLIEGADYPLFQMTLAPGDRLFLLSDGITECPGAAGGMLGEDGLADMISQIGRDPLGSLAKTLLARLSAYTGTDAFPDDVSGMVLAFDH